MLEATPQKGGTGQCKLPRPRAHVHHAAAKGIHPKITPEMLGRARANISLDIYSHVIPDLGDVAVGGMEGVSSRPCIARFLSSGMEGTRCPTYETALST